MSYKSRLTALIDCATNPVLYELLVETGYSFEAVYEGLPEEALGSAGLFLIEIDDPAAEWVTQVDQLDLSIPCLSLIWSRVTVSELAAHLRAFLIAEIPGRKTALVRYFDPRNTGAVFDLWPGSVMKALISPMERWMYRGRNKEWQRVENDALNGANTVQSIAIRFDQALVDLLDRHCEPDGILTALIDDEQVDPDSPYLERISDLMPRHKRALQWKLNSAEDRKRYCEYSYLRGEMFDRHPYVHSALSERQATGERFDSVMDRVPDYVWAEVIRAQSANAHSSDLNR